MSVYGVVPTSVIEIADAIERILETEYDRGYEGASDKLEPECEEQIAEAADAARLRGFEEGYDEAREVFQKEGIEDVKAQGYERGFNSGQIDGFTQGRAQGRKEGRSAERLDETIRRSRGEHGC